MIRSPSGQHPQHPIDEWLKSKGMSISALAEKAGVPRPCVSRLISGTREGVSTRTMRALLKVFDGEVTADAIYRWQPPPTKSKAKK